MSRYSNRVIHIYTFILSEPPAKGMRSLTHSETFESSLQLGRFKIHLHQIADYFKVLATGILKTSDLTREDGEQVPQMDYQWKIISDYRQVVQLHLERHHETNPTKIAEELSVLCHQRHQLLIEGLPLPKWVDSQISDECSDLVWEQDVLQIVQLSQPQAKSLASEREEQEFSKTLNQIILRAPTREQSHRPPAIKYPGMLNLTSDQVGGHGRGVLAIGGIESTTVNAFYITATAMLAGLSRLRAVRRQVTSELDTLRILEDDVSELHHIQNLTETVRKLQLELTVSVQSYIDGIHMPELIVDEFRRSFRDSLGLVSNLESTQSLLESLSNVSELYRAESRAERERLNQQTRERWQVIALVASGVVFPFGFLISYFGFSTQVDVAPDTSAFDFDVYGVPWILTLASSLVILIAAIAIGIRNKIRSTT